MGAFFTLTRAIPVAHNVHSKAKGERAISIQWKAADCHPEGQEWRLPMSSPYNGGILQSDAGAANFNVDSQDWETP